MTMEIDSASWTGSRFKAKADTVVGYIKDLARPFSIYAGAVAVAYAAVIHPEVDVVAVAAAMVSGNAFFHGKDKVSIARIDAGATEPGTGDTTILTDKVQVGGKS